MNHTLSGASMTQPTDTNSSEPASSPASPPAGGAKPSKSHGDRPPLPRRFNLIRSFALADFITLGNAAAGTASVFLCLNYVEPGHEPLYLWLAFALLPLAFVFDAADGAVACWRRKSSPYGADLDSLADIVSFGVAPAVLAFTLGMRGLWDALVLIYFVSCGIGRLARCPAPSPSPAASPTRWDGACTQDTLDTGVCDSALADCGL
jgi:hypothetical protein